MRRKFFKSFALSLVTLICTVMCSGCLPVDWMLFFWMDFFVEVGETILEETIDEKSKDANKNFVVVDEPVISCTLNNETQLYDVSIDGVVKNDSIFTCKMSFMELRLYDADGNVLKEIIVYGGHSLSPSSTWSFNATAQTNQSVASVEVYNFSSDDLD